MESATSSAVPPFLADCDVEGEFAEEDVGPPPVEPPVPQFGTIVEDTFGFYIEILEENHIHKLSNVQSRREIHDVVKRYTITNNNGVSIQLINYGATITSILCPDKDGLIEDIVLGFDTIEGYRSDENQYFGGIIGRVAGLIPNAMYHVGDKCYYLSNNKANHHHFNGGHRGLDKVLWDSHVNKEKVVMCCCDDEYEGYPGRVMTQVSYHLTWDNRLVMEIQVTVSQPTPISITNHTYFNLAGHGAGPNGLKNHCMVVNADRYIVTDIDNHIPTGELREVAGTYYDFRVPRSLGKALERVPKGGYDDTFCITKISKNNDVIFAARLVHPDSGRYLEVFTNNPGLHVYTADTLPDPDLPKHSDLEHSIVCARMDEPLLDDRPVMPFEMDPLKWPNPEPSDRCLLCGQTSWYPEEVPLSLGDVQRISIIRNGSTEEFQEELRKSMLYEPMEDNEPLSACQEYLMANKDSAESDVEEEGAPCWSPPKEIAGKSGVKYRNQCAICLMPQEYPNAVNQMNFPSPIVCPGDTYLKTIIYKIGIIHPRKPSTPTFSSADVQFDEGEGEDEDEDPFLVCNQ